VCLISGGEFSCPVRGAGVGGRNAETVLRCAFEIETHAARARPDHPARVVALSAGTDGIDGNSHAAGAWCDATTLARARRHSLDAQKFLAASDAHTFFAALGDAITTGPTGTNVRDLRLLLAG
jgi:hydroxypyruvate reductase